MHFRITGDTDTMSGVGPIVVDLSGPSRKIFLSKNYGEGLLGIGVVLMCQDPTLNLKRRVRRSTMESKIYMDIMLDLPTMKIASCDERKRVVAQMLYEDVPAILSSYDIPNFNKFAFIADLRAWIDGLRWR